MPPKKYHKILRNNINGISKPAIHRLCELAGANNVAENVYEAVRNILLTKMNNSLKVAVTYMTHDKRKTLLLKDLEAVERFNGGHFYSTGEGDKYVACKDKKSMKKHSGACVVIPKLPFERLTREILQDYVFDVKISEDFKESFQFLMEKKMINHLTKAVALSIAIGERKTLYEKDVFAVQAICEKA